MELKRGKRYASPRQRWWKVTATQYDVRDFKAVAPRYGTMADLDRLVEALHTRGMRLMLDLVPGHTSIDHPWFLESCKHELSAAQ